jgi:hypothetical protein
VTAALPDRLPQDLWAPDLLVALASYVSAAGLLELSNDREASKVPEDHPGGVLLKVKEIESVSDRAVVVIIHGVVLLLRESRGTERTPDR